MINKEHIDDLFVKASDEERASVQLMREPITYWQDAWRRFKKNKIAMISAIFIIIITLSAIFIPIFSHIKYDQISKGTEYLEPFKSYTHPLGTDNFGRDMLIRLMYGARISLAIGVVASIMIVFIGVIYGTVAGYIGGAVDNIMMRIVDIIYSVPSLLIILILTIVLKERLDKVFAQNNFLSSIGAPMISIFITFSLLYWVDMARMVRGQILGLKQLEYVNAAKALGSSPWRIMRKHLIPNCVGVIIVTGMLNIPLAIFSEAFLSYIGLGVSAPMASLGSLSSNALDSIYSHQYLLILPSALISLIILSFNLLGDGLRDALDPRMKSKGA